MNNKNLPPPSISVMGRSRRAAPLVISSVVEKSQRSLHALRLVEMTGRRGCLVEMTKGVWNTIEALEPESVIFEKKPITWAWPGDRFFNVTVPARGAEGSDIPSARQNMGIFSLPMGGRGDLGSVRRDNPPSDCGAEPQESASGPGCAYRRFRRWHQGRPRSRCLSNGHCSDGRGHLPSLQGDNGVPCRPS